MSGLADLYPFLDSSRADADATLLDARRSALQKADDIAALRMAVWERHADDLVTAARLLARSFRAGGKVLAFGNGGSATDGRDLVIDLASGPHPLPAIDLTQDYAMVTAVANDVGFDKIFSRQIIAHGMAGDVAVGFSTSGESRNVNEAFAQARRQGLRTIGFSGNQGGRMAEPGFVDVLIVAPSPHNTRVQEAQATACHTMLAMLRALLCGDAE